MWTDGRAALGMLLSTLCCVALLCVPPTTAARSPKHHAATEKSPEELADSTAPRSVPDFTCGA